MFTDIRVNCANYKGTAFKHYLDFLATIPRDELVAKVRKLITEFEAELGLTTRLRALHHAAMNFGSYMQVASLPLKRDYLRIKFYHVSVLKTAGLTFDPRIFR